MNNFVVDQFGQMNDSDDHAKGEDNGMIKMEEPKEQMMSLLSAASAIKAENSMQGASAERSNNNNNNNDNNNDNDNNNNASNESKEKTTALQLDEDVPMTFPQRLMEILSSDQHGDVISWLPHGKGFIIYKKKKFATEVLPMYFKQSKFTSFTRKLNRWGFTRVTRGPETGAYYHKFFQRGDLRLCMQMSCQSMKPPGQQQAQQQQHQQQQIPGVPFGLGSLGKNPFFGVAFPGMTGGAGGAGGAGAGAGGNGNPSDLTQQNHNLIRHQLQQLQLQQLQLQQLQLQQQQQFQAAELLRQALSKKKPGDSESGGSNNNNDSNNSNAGDPSALFLQTLQRTKESGNGLMGTQPLALIPALQGTPLSESQGNNGNEDNKGNNEPSRPPTAGGNGRAWAA